MHRTSVLIEVIDMAGTMNENKILRIKEVVDRTGLSRSTILRRVEGDEFPAPLRLGGEKSRAVGWRTDDLYRWMEGLARD